SLKGVFLINYLSSLVSVNLLLFVPAMVGLVLGAALGRGAGMLVLLPLLASFVLMVTAVTYQFQGWLASLMVNPRRRKTILALVTIVFVVVCQLPQLINWLAPWRPDPAVYSAAQRYSDDLNKLRQAFSRKEIDSEEYTRRSAELTRQYQAQQKN